MPRPSSLRAIGPHVISATWHRVAASLVVGALLLRADAALAADEGVPGVVPAQPDAPSAARPSASQAASQATSQSLSQAVRGADAVLAAFRAGDSAALADLAAKSSPDPWSVAHDLIGRGELDAAAAYAVAGTGADAAALPAYVATRRGTKDDAVSRAACREGESVLRAKDFARALTIYEPVRVSPDPVLASYGARGVGLALEGLNRRAQAVPVYLESAARAESIGWLRRAATVLSDAADCAEDLGDIPSALPIRERIVAVQTQRGAKRSLASALWNVGFAYGALSQPDRALRWYERSREVLVSVGSVWGEARMLQAEGESLRAHGRPAEAWLKLERAIALFDKEGSLRTRGRCRATAAQTLTALGRRADAAAMFETAATQYIAGGDVDGACSAWLSLSDLSAAQGDWSAQAALLDRIDRTAGERQSAETEGGVLIRRSAILARDGQAAAALECAAAAVESFARARKRGRVSRAMQAAREILRRDDAAGLALPFHEKILALAVRRGNPRLETDALGGIAAAHVAAGRDADALAAVRRAVERMADLPPAVGEEQWAGLRWEFPEALGAGAVAATRADDVVSLLSFLEAGRASALLDSMRSFRAASSADVPADLRDDESAAIAAEAESTAALRRAVEAGDGEKAEEARTALEQARADLRDVLERTRRRTASSSPSTDSSAASVDGVRARLAAGEAFVSFGISVAPGLDHAVALVVTKTQSRIVPLGKGTDVARACDALVAANPAQDAVDLADALRKLVTEPLGLGAETTRVTVSPDGALAYAPPALLFPGREVSYVPSAAAHTILAERARERGTAVLALGDPDYAAASDDGTLAAFRSGVVLRRLPASGDEARAVGDVVLTRAAANESGFRAALATRPRWRAVHFACHGSVDERNTLFSSLALTPSPGDDGFLTALEVHRLIVSADLVTLSACETGRGRLYPGEGSAGLAQAFMVAGAPRVLVSLWKVDDAATAVLMRRFYDVFRRGVPAARALREAQEFVRADERWRHPRFWAAWVLWGDGG